MEIILQKMEKTKKINLFERAFNLWGADAQVKMLNEEIGELLAAMGKFDRRRVGVHDVITELADVSIMVEQMADLFGYEEFEKEKDYKLTRLEERLNKYEREKMNEIQKLAFENAREDFFKDYANMKNFDYSVWE